MSYIYLQEAGEESSAACFSDISPSALSKLNHSAGLNCFNARGTECFHGSQYGTMSPPLTENLGMGLLMSSAEDFPAKTSVAPAQQTGISDSPGNAPGFGARWPGLFAKWDRNTSSWKTLQGSLLEDLESFSETWPRWGMMLAGASYQQPVLAPPISESEFGYLPTPDASLGLFDCPAEMDLVTSFRKETTGVRPSGAKIGSSLRWHPEFIHEWQRTGGELNAQWIEVLMGWPIDWTACTPVEMAKFHSWLQLHGISSSPETPTL
jgi:hypothetical protein